MIIRTRNLKPDKKTLPRKHDKMVTTRDRLVQEMEAERNAKQFFRSRWADGLKGRKRFLTDLINEKIWKGRRAFVLAGGPSLQGFDFSCLEDELTIGVNRIYEYFEPTILFAMDGRFYKWIHENKYPGALEKFQTYQGLKVWVDIANAHIDDVWIIRPEDRYGLTDKLSVFYHGNNSGYGALSLALALGADPIYLLGYDMKGSGGKMHFHNGHPVQTTDRSIQCFIAGFTRLQMMIKKTRVINLNRASKLKCFPFGDLPKDVSVKKMPVFVSYYTPKYKDPAMNLKESLWQFTIRHHIEEYPDQGSWIANIQYKPVFIKAMMEKFDRPIVWLDADAQVIQYPELMFELSGRTDFASYLRPRKWRRVNPEGHEMLSGTLFFNNTPKGKKLLDLWIKVAKALPYKWDQVSLARAVEKWGFSFTELPPDYCCVFDGFEKKAGLKPIIEHYQHSRRMRYA